MHVGTIFITNLSDSYALSSSGTGTTTTITVDGNIAESWGSDSISETFGNFQLVITPGVSDDDITQDLSVTGSLSLTFNPEICQNGNFTFVTNTPVVFDDTLGYTTAGELTINGATTVLYNDDGSITVTTNGTSQTYPNGYALTQVCPIATLGEPAAPTYTVTYSGNNNTGGSPPVDPNDYDAGATVTVLGQGSLVKTGYSFVGWNTAVDGSGTTYTSGQTFTMGTANVTLYAKWTASPTYTVTYNGNSNTGGSVPVDTNNYEEGATVTVLGQGSLVNTGNTFVGWNTEMNGSGTSYTTGQQFAMPAANVTLYAQWTASTTYTVTYNGNGNTGGSVPVDTNNYVEGATVTVQGSGTLVKSGNTFAGWNTQMNGSGTTYTPGQQFTMPAANVTLYAVWTTSPAIIGYAYVANYEDGTVSQYTIGSNGVLSAMTPPTVVAEAPNSIAVDPSGQYVYVVNHDGSAILQYEIGVDGSLSPLTPSATGVTGYGVYSIAVDPLGKYAYTTDDPNSDVSEFAIGPGGSLTSLPSPTIAGGVDPVSIAVDPKGRYAYAANYGYGVAPYGISQYVIGGDGTLSALTPSIMTTGIGLACVVVDPTSQYVYSGSYAADTIFEYTISSDGTLTAMNPATVTTGGRPIAIAIDPVGPYVYVVNQGLSYLGSVSEYTISPTASGLQSAGALLGAGVPVSTGDLPVAIAIDPSGKYAYVVNADDNDISQYAIGTGGNLSTMATPTVAAGSYPVSIVTVAAH